MRRRLLSLLLAVTMVLGMLPVNVFAAEIPFAVTVNGEEVADITESILTWESMYGDSLEVTCYTVTVPEGSTEATLNFTEERQWSYYNSNGTYLGDGDTSWTAATTHTVAVADQYGPDPTGGYDTSTPDGELDGISVQLPDAYSTEYFILFVYAEEEMHTCVFDQEDASDDYLCTEADCDNAATYYLSCECGEAGEETFSYGEPAGHSYDNGKVTTEPGCETAGVKTFTCSVCSGSYTEEVEATGHNYADGVCGNCGEADPDYVPPVQEPDKPFLSIALNGVELEADRIIYKGIFALGDYAEDEQQGVEDSYDYVHEVPYYHVSVPCGTASVDVSYSADTNILNNGTDAYGYRTDLEVDAVSSATVRGTTFKNAYTKNEDGTQTVKTPVTGYTFDADGNGHAITLEEDGDSYAAVCLFTFEYDGLKHVYDSEVTTAATCTADGVKTFTCSCGDSYTESIGATGHSYADGTCANCGEADPDYVAPGGAVIPDGSPFTALTTDQGDAEEIVFVESVTYTGYESYENVPYYHVIIPAGASSVYVTHPTTEDPFADASYGSAYGYYAETSGWTGGGISYAFADNEDGYTITLPLSKSTTDWNTGETTEMSFVADEEGYVGYALGVERNDYSPICFFTFEYAPAEEGEHVHSYDDGVVTTEPTCTAAGVKTFTCSGCKEGTEGHSYEEAIAAVGHSYDKGLETTPATCVADGVKTFTCSACAEGTQGHTRTESIPKLGHKYDEGTVTTEATCTEPGVKTFTCSQCAEGVEGHTKTEAVSATGHAYANGKCLKCGDVCPVIADGVYQIGTAEELLWFANAVNGGNKAISAALTADIALDADWPGIGDYTNRFAGSFDGQNHTVTLPGSTFGLFGYTMGTYDGNGNTKTVVAIQNVILDGTVQNSALIQNAGYTHITNCINKADITGGNANVAGIVGTVSGFKKYGQTYSDVLIQNCANEGNINGENYTAGIVGYSQANTRLNSCCNTGTISGTNYVGGLVGFLQEAKGTCEIKNSYNRGAVTGSSYVGGICGDTYNGVNIENCYNAGECVYGITGHIYNKTASIVNCYYQGTKSDKGVPDNTFSISATAVTAVELSSAEFAAQLGSAYIQSCPAPALSWQETQSHTGMEEDGICDVCGLGGNVKEEYKVTFPTGEGFTVTGEAAAIQGETYTFTLTVNNGYRKLSTFAVKVNGDIVSESTEAADSYTVENVEGPLTITVEGVEKIPETLTVTLPNGEGKGYRVTPEVAGSTTAAYDGTFRFKVTMHENFRKTGDFQVLVNGSLVITSDEEGWYTLNNVRENKTVTVSGVEPKPYNDTADILLTITQGETTIYKTPQSGSNQMLLHTEMQVPYFDISLYGLNCYYNPDCYGLDEEGNRKPQTAGNAEIAYGVITPLHAFIYATEVHYLGVPADKVGTGWSYQQGTFQEAISWSGGVGSIFMRLWDHGSNLNYYVNYEYPLGQPGWGSTSDQIALNDGDVISAHMIMSGELDENGNAIVESSGANGSAYGIFVAEDDNGAFDYGIDTIHSYEVQQGDIVDLTLFSSVATSTYDTAYTTIAGQQLYWVHDDYLTEVLTDWNLDEDMITDENGCYELDTSDFEPGIYYIGALGGFTEGDGKPDAGGFTSKGYERGAAVLKLTVTEGSTEEPELADGDVNGDSYITADDAAAAFAASKSTAGMTEAQIAAADVTGDGYITADDAATIFAMSKGGAN